MNNTIYRNIKYIYYLYGIKKMNCNTVNAVFSEGIVSFNGPDIKRCMIKLGESMGSIEEVTTSNGFQCVFIIKIPKMYLYPKVEDGKLKQVPVPMWEERGGADIFKSSLIHGAYSVVDQTYFENEFYNEVYNPNGLQFDSEQVNYFIEMNMTRWIKFNLYRKKRTYEELLKIDRTKTIWKDAITQYTSYYNKRIVKKLNREVVA